MIEAFISVKNRASGHIICGPTSFSGATPPKRFCSLSLGERNSVGIGFSELGNPSLKWTEQTAILEFDPESI